MIKVVQSPEPRVCRNPYNSKWYIQFVVKGSFLKKFLMFNSYNFVEHVYEPIPYVDPDGKSYWQVKYFESATDAQQYIIENLYPLNIDNLMDSTNNKELASGLRNV